MRRCATCDQPFTHEHPPTRPGTGRSVHRNGCPKKKRADELTLAEWQRLSWRAAKDTIATTTPRHNARPARRSGTTGRGNAKQGTSA